MPANQNQPIQKVAYPIFTGFNVLNEPYLSSETHINMYAEINRQDGSTYLSSTMGLKLEAIFGADTEIRASSVSRSNILYVVASKHVYSLDTLLVPTLIGTLATETGHVSISSNQNQQIAFTDEVFVYIYKESDGTFNQNPTNSPTAPATIDYLHGYFIVPTGLTNQFYISALNDGVTWNVLQFALFQGQDADYIVSIVTVNQLIWIFGRQNIEVWRDVGGPFFPFRRDNSLIFSHGAAAVAGIAKGFNRLVYLSADRDGPAAIMLSTKDQVSPIEISTLAINQAIQKMVNVSDAEAFLYRDSGSIFYQINFTTANRSFLYNFTSNSWSELMVQNGDRYPARSHSYFANKHLIGTYNQPWLAHMSTDYFTNFDDGMKRTIIGGALKSPILSQRRLDKVGLDVIPGEGATNNTGNGTDLDPVVTLSISQDNGFTYGNAIPQPIGKQGDFTFPGPQWFQNGIGRTMVLKFDFYNHTKFYVMCAYVFMQDMTI